MDFLQMGPHAIKLTTINPQVRNKGRMAQVLKFFKMEGGGQYLRRTSLCLQLTGMATSITAKKSAPDAVPLLVRLFEGEVIVKTQVHLSHLLTELWRDPTLDAGACISAMLLTVCDIVLRFRVFLGYPYRLCSLCRRFNPEYLVACMHFLRAEDSALDVGLSIPLRKLARAQGDELLQIRFLTSDAVQGALEDLFDGASGSTLEVERKHVETKRNETSRLSHVAVASRNQILRWFHRRAQQIGANIRRATRDHAKALATNVWSPAWKRCDDYRPRPPGCTATARGDGSKPCTLAQQGDTAARNQFVHEHNAELSAELGAKRAAAKAALELARSSIRATSAEWLEWMRANMTEGASFRAKMRTSTKERRGRSRRLCARSDLPPPVTRIQPEQERWKPTVEWAKCLWGRNGWHGVRTRDGMSLIFLDHYLGQTFYVDVGPFRTGQAEYLLGVNFDVQRALQPLVRLHAALGDTAVCPYEFLVRGTPTKNGVVVSVVRALEIKEPLKRRARQSAEDGDGDECTDDSVLDIPDLDDSDHAPSVDTDVDTLVSSPVGTDGEAVTSSAESDDEGEAPRPPHGPRMPHAFWKVLDHPWYTITDTTGGVIRAQLKKCWATAAHMGVGSVSKTLPPARYGDPREHPEKTMILLRAWVVWRACRDGWAMRTPGRQRQLDKDSQDLERDIRAIQGPTMSAPLLGNPSAHLQLVSWVPDSVKRVLA